MADTQVPTVAGRPLKRGPRRWRRGLAVVALASLTLVFAGIAVDHVRGGPDVLPDAVGAMRPAFVEQPGWKFAAIHDLRDKPILYVWRNNGLQPTATAVEWSAWSEPLTLRADWYMRDQTSNGPSGGQWEEGQRLGSAVAGSVAPLADDAVVWSTDCQADSDSCWAYEATIRYGRSILQVSVAAIRLGERLPSPLALGYLHDVVAQMNKLESR